jgi:hypothetical protein
VSRGTSSGGVYGALRGSILRPVGHIAIVHQAGRLWGSLLQGHPAQGPPIISTVCCWGRIDHRNNIADILSIGHPAVAVGSIHHSQNRTRICTPGAPRPSRLVLRDQTITAAASSHQLHHAWCSEEIPVPEHTTDFLAQTETTSDQVHRPSRLVLRTHRPGHLAKNDARLPASIVIPTASDPNRPAGSPGDTRARTPRHTPCHRQPRLATPSASGWDTADPVDSDQWVSIQAGALWHPGPPTRFGSVRGGPPLPHLRTHPCDPSRSLFYTVGYAGSPTL